MRGKVELLSKELATITHQQSELFKTAKGFEETLATLRMKQNEAVKLRQYIEEIGESMTHLRESDEDLLKTQREYSQRLQQYEQHIDERRQRAVQITDQLNQVRMSLNDKLKEHGRIQAENNAFQKDLRQREDMVREINNKHDIYSLPGRLDSDEIDRFINEISRMARDQNSRLDSLRSENQRKVAAAQGRLTELQRERESHETKKSYAQQEIANTDIKIRGFNRDLLRMSVDDGREAILASELSAKESQLSAAKKRFEADGMDTKHRELADKLKDCEERRDTATEELGDVTRHADSRARLGILQRNKKLQETALSTLSVATSEPYWSSLTIHAESIPKNPNLTN